MGGKSRWRIRTLFPGAIYHVYTRGSRRGPIFRDDKDRWKFYDYLATASERYELEIRTLSQMDNHVHLHLLTKKANLPQAMGMLFSAYAGYFNRRHGSTGHVMESRYCAPIVEPGFGEVRLSRYIHRNPPEAGMVARPEDWPWSTYRAYLGREEVPEWLHPEDVLSLLGGPPEDRVERYREYVEAESRETKEALEAEFERTIAVGSPAFRAAYGDVGVAGEAVSGLRPAAQLVVEVVEQVFTCGGLTGPSRERPPQPGRLAAALLLSEVSGLVADEIGRILGGVNVRTIRRHLHAARVAREADRLFAEAVHECLLRLKCH